METMLSFPVTNARKPWLFWMMLPARLVLFAAFQALFALGYRFAEVSDAWNASAAWWPFTVTLTNLVCVALLIPLFQQDDQSYFQLFRIQKGSLKTDLLAFLGVLIIAAPVAMLPNVFLAKWLFGDITTAMSLFIRHLPAWAAYSGFLLFPVTQGMAELVIYFRYVEPGLEAQTGKRWMAVCVSALALGIQHVAMPLIFNGSFILWRMLMFLPFAVLLGVVIRWRLRLLPYLAILHVLMDMGTAAMLLTA